MKIANFPNPQLRPKGEPAELVSPHFVVNLYNVMHALKVGSVDDNVKAWFKAEAKEVGWKRVEFFEGQALLSILDDPDKMPYTVPHGANLWEYIGDLSQDLLECSYNDEDVREMWLKHQLNGTAQMTLREQPHRLARWQPKDGNYHDLMTALVKLHGGWASDWGPEIYPLTPQERVMVSAFEDKYRVVIANPV